MLRCLSSLRRLFFRVDICGRSGIRQFISQRESPVVEALAQKNNVCEGVVDGKDDHCR